RSHDPDRLHARSSHATGGPYRTPMIPGLTCWGGWWRMRRRFVRTGRWSHGQVSVSGLVHRGGGEGCPQGGRVQSPRDGRGADGGPGGSLESFYFAFGEDDVYLIGDVPDNVSSAAVSMTVGASGAARVKTVVLLTAEEIDQATQRSVAYRPP